jgi:hypothetical protein
LISQAQTTVRLSNRHPSLRKALTGLTGLIACCIAVACSSPTDTAATPAPAQSGASDRLAVVTRSGVMLWSSTTGLRRIGPPLPSTPGTSVSELTWSPDGHYLAWIQGNSNTDSDELVRVDARRDTWMTWQSEQGFGTISFSGSRPLTISGSFLYSFHPNGSTSPSALTTYPSISAPYNGGFIFAGNPENVGSAVEVWRAGTDGETTKVGILPSTGRFSEYDEMSASPDGRWIALERGDHTDVCGNGPSSRLVLMNTETGAVTSPRLPVPRKTVWRFSNIMYGTDSVVDFSAYEVRLCDSDVRFPTRLFEMKNGRISVVANNATVGQRGPNGQLAMITGQDAFKVVDQELPDLAVDGRQRLEVNGKDVPTPTTPTFLSWAP